MNSKNNTAYIRDDILSIVSGVMWRFLGFRGTSLASDPTSTTWIRSGDTLLLDRFFFLGKCLACIWVETLFCSDELAWKCYIHHEELKDIILTAKLRDTFSIHQLPWKIWRWNFLCKLDFNTCVVCMGWTIGSFTILRLW